MSHWPKLGHTASPGWEAGDCFSSRLPCAQPKLKGSAPLKKGKEDIGEPLMISATLKKSLCVGFWAIFISSPKNYLSYSPFSIALIIPFFFLVMLLIGELPKTICNNNT